MIRTIRYPAVNRAVCTFNAQFCTRQFCTCQIPLAEVQVIRGELRSGFCCLCNQMIHHDNGIILCEAQHFVSACIVGNGVNNALPQCEGDGLCNFVAFRSHCFRQRIVRSIVQTINNMDISIRNPAVDDIAVFIRYHQFCTDYFCTCNILLTEVNIMWCNDSFRCSDGGNLFGGRGGFFCCGSGFFGCGCNFGCCGSRCGFCSSSGGWLIRCRGCGNGSGSGGWLVGCGGGRCGSSLRSSSGGGRCGSRFFCRCRSSCCRRGCCGWFFCCCRGRCGISRLFLCWSSLS